MRSFFLLIALAASLSTPVRAQAPAASLPGRVAPVKVLAFDPRLTKADTGRMAAEAQRVLFGPLLATPALKAPQGFAIVPSLSIKPAVHGLPATGPSSARGNIILLGIDPAHGSKPDAAGAYNGVGEGPAIQFTLNDPTALFETSGAEEARPEYLPLRLGAPRRGWTVLRIGASEIYIIAKPGRTPYRMVTQREALERDIGDRAVTLAQLGAAAAPVLRKAQTDQQAELASLTPDAGAAPACLGGDRRRGSFSPCDDPRAYHLATIDPAYFDAGLPKTAVQLITLSVTAPNRDENMRLTPVTRAAVDQLDLTAVQQALK